MITLRETALFCMLTFAALLCAPGAWAGDHDVADDFSLASNPNGVWSYGTRASASSTVLTLHPSSSTSMYGVPGLHGWYSGGAPWYLPSIWTNTTSSPISRFTFTMQPGDVFMHPLGDYSILRFKAPSAGVWSVDVRFAGVDVVGATTDVHVVDHNGVVIVSSYIHGGLAAATNLFAYQGDVTLAAGEWIDFAVGNGGGSFFYDSTSIELSIRSANTSPAVSAGQNVTIDSEDQGSTVITGTATDSDGDTLVCRWLEGSTVLAGPTTLTSSSCALDLSTLSTLSVGDHTLTLEIDDGSATVTDDMVLTIDNSPPTAAPSGAGVYELGSGSVVALGGQVADFDGDTLTYVWREAGSATAISSGTITTSVGGTPVALSTVTIGTTTLGLGVHTIELEVDDGKNAAVVSSIEVQVTDTTAPTLSLSCSSTILWPPNHNMVDVTVATNPEDDGGAVTVTASVTSNEPVNGLGDGDTGPDWDEVSVNSTTGAVSLELRSERSGKGQGRVYTVWITATDTSGNASTASCEVRVPKSKGK